MKNKWNERYQGSNFFYGEEPNDFLKSISAHFSPNSKILCLAEGEGRNAVYLARSGHLVTAVDQSTIGLQKCNELAKKFNVIVNTTEADLNDFRILENEWDVIVSIWCHLPSDLRRKVHQNSSLGLKKDGLFVLEAYTPDQLKFKTGGPDNVDMLMTQNIFQQEFSNMEIIQSVELVREIHEGQGHNGISSVLQAVAKKI